MIEDGKLYRRFSGMNPKEVTYWIDRWPNFSLSEIACSHCGELLINYKAMDTIEIFRLNMMGPVFLNSAYRCKIYNDEIGSNDRSQHRLAAAFDVAHRTGHPAVLDHVGRLAGFKGHGYYNTFQHKDIGSPRTWDERS